MSKIFDYAVSQVPDEVKRFIDNSLEIANEIHSILEKQGKTQRDLAILLGKNESEISKWLTGTHNFTLKSLSKIEAILNEKIVTTPLQSQMNFLKMAEKAITFHDFHYTGYFEVVKQDFNFDFVEITRMEKNVEPLGAVLPIAGEQESYAMVA
ncbi:MAG: helix-turn-helix transcriptional regulator [Cytophagales bacterium]|jgi:transcriptional regulator with XRE-family HTH domain|uniref:helix-turn-helix domain-containing protein n=1 Tax=Microcystis sp. M176S2 TaxID=2771159 RepID=UPI00258E4D5D|nr:helix-turn-helix transcriptional regulator [Microcystis sp. M176S2]MCA6379231.1 helix-turn-helix transcriptional regulator [Cytophagales bacterium]MCA2721214.1 helix-turn-helix transcriptional regulator [Microcystis sp. M176S2]MCA6387514.1 helix-turn-helix transcriptional regulator [Cytophagales bacterium]MCA6391185.1 helix-turn-helix transcriptional regulator [Cytophagales bacterium]MCA6395823.1 helix-turn-helix transcriptional regulator [Cytophagales bacterium]